MASSTAAACVGRAVGLSWGVRSEAQQQSRRQQQQRHSVSLAGGNNAATARCLSWGPSSAVSSDGSAASPTTANALLRIQPRRRRTCPSSSSSSRRGLAVVAAGDIERSYIMIKPDGVQRGLVGEIISRFERKGFTLKGLKLFETPQELAETHYGELKEKPFFPKLVKYIISGPVVAMVWEGPGVVASARKLIGVTNPLNAEPGTIRGDFGVNTGRNVIHGSDSPENGEREIALWFKEGEVVEWEPTLTPWILE